jgi:hypothetical protein
MHPAQIFCVVVFAAAVIASGVIQEAVRSQLVSRLYGEQQISWRDFRTIGDWFGQGGMWRLHRQYYPTSRLRFWFAASLSTMVLALTLGSVFQAYGVR